MTPSAQPTVADLVSALDDQTREQVQLLRDSIGSLDADDIRAKQSALRRVLSGWLAIDHRPPQP